LDHGVTQKSFDHNAMLVGSRLWLKAGPHDIRSLE
jgi:hypothetical protein